MGDVVDDVVSIELQPEAQDIARILGDASVYESSSDDLTPAASDVDLLDIVSSSHLIPFAFCVNGAVSGVFLVRQWNSILFEVHTAIPQSSRGKNAFAAARQFLITLFGSTSCQKLLTLVPSFNRPAKIFAMRAGMKEVGVIRASFLKGGVLHDQCILEINRGEICQ